MYVNSNYNTIVLKACQLEQKTKKAKGKVHEKKVKKKLTSVRFAFTHTYTLEKLTLLLFSPSVHGKF